MRKVLLVCLVLVGAAHGARAESLGFDKDRSGELPKRWKEGVTGGGAFSWKVAVINGAPSGTQVLRQSGKGDFPWAVLSGTSLTDGFVETKFRSVSGEEDQAGGVIWRFKDGENYYLARANALEDNVALYFVTRGKRNTLKSVDTPVSRGSWHHLRVEFSGQKIKVLLNGKTQIDFEDATISGPGNVGLWTKADSVTEFDDFGFGIAK